MTTITLFEEWVSAWFSSFVGEDDSYKISLEQFLIERPSTTISIRIKGESMLWAGILPWDIAIVDTAKIPFSWNLVIAILDWVYTIKFLQKDAKWRSFLRAANKAYWDIYPNEDLSIFWVVVGVIRKYV
ncbi:MAG: hypothetical protein ACD_3C00035G0010 [uncultured bacterium (gcode 4)]|uniref:Peptidase S24/S26A/S26B/S26C domain-containing protein n=1 Tax=uncultured bacterium (gcode 4) TaxID=1234023 RepID=K2GZ00_9BACT|nr:MAG: hypothetical protein ACD_3C00035G0010 [uncultured bacterium (gcode 4)]